MGVIYKCRICGLQFDKDKTEYTKDPQHQRRYVHTLCLEAEDAKSRGEEVTVRILNPPLKAPEKSDTRILTDYINVIFNQNVNWPYVMSVVKKLKENYGYDELGIKDTLMYLHEIKHRAIEKESIINIVPYYYMEAQKYYTSIKEVREQNQDKNFIQTEKVIIIKPPKMRGKFNKLIDLEEFIDAE